MNKILIGSDKSGFVLKETIKEYLAAQGLDVEDLGTTDIENPRRFCDVAPVVAQAVSSGQAERAILICGTGMGMAQVAGMYPGVFAAACESVYAARMCRAVNNSNILCMGAWIVGTEMALEMVKAFLATDHTEGLEEWRQAFLKQALCDVQSLDKEVRGR